MEKELFIIQDLLRENNDHLKTIRRWIAIAGFIFITIPITVIILSILGVLSLAIL